MPIDFLIVSARPTKRGYTEIYPRFRLYPKSSDLMIRGGDFYAVWVEERGLWSTDEQDALQLIDRELDRYAEKNKDKFEGNIKVLHMWDSESGMIDSWHKFCQKQMRDNFRMLDEKIIFSDTETKKEDYASKRLPYPLAEGDISAYDKLMSTLYSEEERRKIEWAIGAIVTGDSKNIQKFMVLYGAVGTGKSTVINIIEQLFDGYTAVFDAKSLGNASSAFALEAFKGNPLVAIQHDADLSHIEDNTRLNSLISHELMTVNEKFRSAYANRFKCFLIIGTNKPVKITDAKSGLIRRLIDVSPSGNKLPQGEYDTAVKQIPFELGAIAYHCRSVYLSDPHIYDNYIPVSMLGATNDFYNFIVDSYRIFENENGTTLKAAWEMYKNYCEDARVNYPFSKRIFKEELKNYFREYKDRFCLDDGTRVRNWYSGFMTDKFEESSPAPKETPVLQMDCDISLLDKDCADCPAQYATSAGTPKAKWSSVSSRLSDIDTSKLHYVKLPENHIVIDFDIPDENGGKSLRRNLETAAKFPPTYGELSRSGAGVHLHYIYTGDVEMLDPIYKEHIEIKKFTGGSALRRKLTKCNDIPIANLSSGLPLKGVKKVVNPEVVMNEKRLRNQIEKNLNKEYHSATKPSIDFIDKLLKEAYESGINYDVTDMQNSVLAFAAGSTNHADYCLKLANKMKFKSDDISVPADRKNACIIFFDVEVFPNLFLVNWKRQGEENIVVRMINPTPAEIESLMQFRLIGFNCRRYDNHILYARLMGYNNEQLYSLSQKIITEGKGFFGEAYNVSYTDVYDFSSRKQSLKKFEIELGIHHQELGLPWDKPVPEEMWTKVAEYCDNDVIATEAVFNARKADFTARQILADVAGMSVNDTTNSLTTKIIFGNNRHPQDSFNYRFMGVDIDQLGHLPLGPRPYICSGDMYDNFDLNKKPWFYDYKFENGKSTYRGEEVGEGGYVYAEPGMYTDVALLDIASMHPSSIVAENLFGDEYTARFKEILDARIAIKHKDLDKAKTMLGGVLAKYLDDENAAADLAQALKIAINSVYGLTSANFENPFRDIRNVDNIVAKRGALFMINLKNDVQKMDYTVAHIKTDSIKIPNAPKPIIDHVTEYGKVYGYNFEHEATYDRMCLVNDAVYIARYKDGKHAGEWTATGTQFAVPYVFKKLFSKEDICFEDMCETKSASTAIYLDLNENLPENEHNYRFVGKVGRFCPVREGCGGGILLRETVNKKTGETGYSAVSGTKGYRWLESEMIKELGKEDCIDISYYEKLKNDAYKTLEKYGDAEAFISGGELHTMPCGRCKCECCIYHSDDDFDYDCALGYNLPF